MPRNDRIATLIIDDDKEAIFALQSFLDFIPQVELKGTSTTWQKAIRLIREVEPDLIFLDIEMPGKNGFELLQEVEKQGLARSFKVIFHTAYDKYTIQALREAAFDYIIKPPTEKEIKEAIGRFQHQRYATFNQPAPSSNKILHQVVSLPTSRGLQFLPKAEIVFIDCRKNNLGLKSSWGVNLSNLQSFKLRPNTNATEILDYLGQEHFVPVSQSAIVNICHVSMIEFKSHLCYLFPPYDDKPLKISRQYMMVLKERFEIL